MKYTKREIISAYRILTKNIQQNDLGWRGKMILSDVLDDYFIRIEGEKVVVDPKYGSFRCPKCNTVITSRYDHYCKDCGQKLDWRETR